MLRHIVLLRMNAATEAERASQAGRLSDALNALPPHIEQIRALSVGRNILENPGNWDLALTVDVDDEAGLDAYRKHPEHLKVIELINETVADRCAVDFPV